MNEKIRKELISYYKWIVSLTLGVITLILTLDSVSEGFSVDVVGKIGLTLLAMSVVFNWLLIKRLISGFIVDGTPNEQRQWIHELFLGGNSNLKCYGFLQNLCFVVGVLLVLISFFS